MKFRPLFNKVIVKRDEAEAMTKGGIALPDKGQQKAMRGTVIAVGPGGFLHDGGRAAMHCKVGDKVVFSRRSDREEIDPSDPSILAMAESDIFAIVE